ncbi:MAG: AAA family ATPase [Actinomycetota bacterium]|nr:AAA family ATPase [Actinomycetota bacterium]
MHAAEHKAQKTWNSLDLAVSVASGTPWLGGLPVDDPGSVVVFAGEGGEGGIVRRLRAICATRGLRAEDLPITVCARAPHLSDAVHLQLLADHLDAVRPRLVVLDPLYLAAAGADGKDLYAMGRLLERPQHLCERVGAALFVVTHFNRSREARGATRITGAGPAEWGRVIIGAAVLARSTDPGTLSTTVLAELEVIGGEVPDQTLRVRRVVRAEDPDDLDSPLHYSVDVIPADASDGGASAAAASPNLAPASRKLLEALRVLGTPATVRQLVDQVAELHGHGLKRETVSRSLNAMLRDGLVDCLDPDAHEKQWVLPASVTGVTVTRDLTPDHGTVTSVTAPIGGHASGHASRSQTPEVTPVEEICAGCRWPTDSLAHDDACRGAA